MAVGSCVGTWHNLHGSLHTWPWDLGVSSTDLPELCYTEYFPKNPLSASFVVAWGNMIFSFSNSCTTFFFFFFSCTKASNAVC